MEVLQQFYLDKEEPNKSCLLALRDLILKQDENISETVKYGMPCFCYKNKMFCYLWIDKKTAMPYILMVEGNFLEHPELVKGSRAKMKTLYIHPEKDLDLNTITNVLQMGLDLYRNGTIKVK